jgi:hypothetical protein
LVCGNRARPLNFELHFVQPLAGTKTWKRPLENAYARQRVGPNLYGGQLALHFGEFMLDRFKAKLRAVLLIGGVSMLSPMTARALSGPEDSAPGGDSFAAGAYSDFNKSAFSSLYWGAWSVALPSGGLTAAGLENLTFDGLLNGTTAVYFANNPFPVELLITVTGLGSNPWVLAASVPGLPSAVGAVVNDSAGLPFQRTLYFAIDLHQGFKPIGNYAGTQGIFTPAFYSTAAVPEPKSYALALVGLGVLAFVARYRSR